MTSLKDLKNRIRGIKSTQKVTKAMRMVAAAKLRKAKDAQESSKPYSNRMLFLIRHILGTLQNEMDVPEILKGHERDDVVLLLVVTSDRGLCGAFNSSIIKKALSEAKRITAQGQQVRFFCVGKKGYDVINRLHKNEIIGHIFGMSSRKLDFLKVRDLVAKLREMFEQSRFDVCMVLYNHFISAISQEARCEKFFPVDASELEQDFIDSKITSYDFEPNKTQILEELVPKHLAVHLYYIFLENNASEHGARMSAMENATKNAGEIIGKLTLIYNRTRQAAITKELIEIISGAEAV
jgi:F-type H+-transporting ATPase subunit gamma